MSDDQKKQPRPENDALKDADVQSGTGKDKEVYEQRKGEAGPASGETVDEGIY